MSGEFGKRLRSLRREKGMSQRRLAAKAGVHYTYVSKLEAGKEHPSQDMAVSLASALKANVAELELAACYVPRAWTKVIAEHPEIRQLLALAAEGRISKRYYQELKDLVEKASRVNVPVALD